MDGRNRALSVFAVLVLAVLGCRPGVPVLDTGAPPPAQDGTIAGHVRTTGGTPLVGRLVKAVPVDGTEAHEMRTSSTGSYTMKVPPGRYRLEVELRDGERLSKQPGETQVNASDLDEAQDFEVVIGG